MDENIFGKTIIATDGQHVLCNPPRDDMLGLAPCNQEEADTRIMVHIADAIKEGHTRVMIRTVDTDVVVIVVSCFHAINAAEIWVAFGTGKHFRYISIHELANTLGLEKAYALPVFHAFTGCDTVSSFAGKGKKTAWDTWMAFNDVTRPFIVMRDQPRTVNVETTIMPLIERFVILMYDRTNISEKVNEARKHLFAQKGRSIEGIPPTQSALFQHTKRSIYQGGIVWGECLKLEPQLPSPNAFGWIKDKSDQWQPFWSDISEASSSCQELIHCGCKRGCRGRCKCGQTALPCTALCACGGECE
ncbi:uncharacterized protein [Mytilus edulis]|uniref:uncharacterized protein n=1 Tax=Mytilus edulis TaxID=6550 RepID=UPI0039EEA338